MSGSNQKTLTQPAGDGRAFGRHRTIYDWSLYDVWTTIKQRCYNPRNSKYKYFGARGIGVCERWRDSYNNFINDLGQRPDGCVLTCSYASTA